jgi:hypothetical protein
MIKTNSNRIWIGLLVLNTAYWLWFWAYFFMHSIRPQPLAWEMPAPFYTVLGRSFPLPEPTVFHSMVIQTAFWLNLPCWLVTWPLGGAMGTNTILHTNAPGLRLVLITALSYGQWYIVSKVVTKASQKLKFRPPNAAIRAST